MTASMPSSVSTSRTAEEKGHHSAWYRVTRESAIGLDVLRVDVGEVTHGATASPPGTKLQPRNATPAPGTGVCARFYEFRRKQPPILRNSRRRPRFAIGIRATPVPDARVAPRSCDRAVTRAVTRSAEPPKRVAGDRLGVSRAQLAAAAAHPGRGVGRIERDPIAVDLEPLVHRVGDDGRVVAQPPHMHVLADREVEDRPRGVLHHAGVAGMIDQPDALRARDDARLVG